uniref:XisH protein n=1 Tax=Candidatus Kentrum sp. MB TaxID=2138164 RepID=A0A450XFL7_9GAMM|nr:MAG: XisH protein [Candidatus Kentron sp. MB]
MKEMYVDPGARRFLAAEKAGRKIDVEIKSFVSHSEMRDFEQAIGQYIAYRDVLRKIEPGRDLYLAISEEIYEDLFEEPIGQLIVKNHGIRLIIFNQITEKIVRWIP